VAACGIDHGLREAARAELRLAAELCASLGVPFATRRVELGPGPGNLQARARAARYAALEDHAARLASEHGGAVLLATAHHADDRAETFVLRLLRGAGLNGLAVLPLREGHRIRPLLRARRRDIDLHLTRHQVPFAHDPSNDDPRFTRVRVRHELLPLLASLDPRVVEHLSALADELVSLRRAGAFAPAPGSPRLALSSQDQDAPPDSLPEDTPALGRRVREALARLGPASPRKMAVRLPKRRVATYDHEADQPVTSEISSLEHRDTPGDSLDSFPRPPRKLP
jgi:tRNA(Ile)-lysidine synthase